ncbi:MAG: BON domain-containing protein [Acidobacteriales bacterium]|nr:BON domain-containing protein [Terriglobales bacterium]
MRVTNLGMVLKRAASGACRKGTWLAVIVTLLASPSLLLASKGPTTLEEKVRHELLMLPYYGVFDELSFQVNGATVTLMGKVTRPVLKSDAANVVKRIPGVASLEDKIEVLPLSPFDDRIRLAELRAVYGNSALYRYRVAGPIAPIRIIVENGNVTLEGIVTSQMDKTIAGLAANGVAGVFSVTNNLQVKS